MVNIEPHTGTEAKRMKTELKKNHIRKQQETNMNRTKFKVKQTLFTIPKFD